MKEIFLVSLYSPQRRALNHLPFSFHPPADWQARPGRRCQDKIESSDRQTDHHRAPHIHHALQLSQGGSNVRPDPSANSLLTRKLEHRVH